MIGQFAIVVVVIAGAAAVDVAIDAVYDDVVISIIHILMQ
jgi:hypothetical protein